MKKRNVILTVCLAVAAAVLSCLLYPRVAVLVCGEHSAKLLTGRYGGAFETVADYLDQQTHDSILIQEDSMDSMLMLLLVDPADGTAKNTTIPIEDAAVCKAVRKLFSLGCNGITKSGETVEFLFWTRLADFGAGVVWQEETSELPDVQFLTRLDALDEEGWFYYESDYNAYRDGKRVE